MDSAEEKCLNLAEKILQAFDDQRIYDRYMKVKQRLMEKSSSVSPTISPKVNQISIENRNLSMRISQLKEEKERNGATKLYVIEQIKILQNQILPCPQMKCESFEDAAQALVDAVDTKFESHIFIKDNLINENKVLKERILQIKSAASAELDNSRNRRINNEAEWQKMESKLQQKLLDIQKYIKSFSKSFIKLEEEKAQYRKGLILIETDKKISNDLEKELYEAEMKNEKLKGQIELLQFKLKKITIELESLKKMKTVTASPETSLPNEAQKLRMQIESLETHNKLLKIELKKMQDNDLPLGRATMTRNQEIMTDDD